MRSVRVVPIVIFSQWYGSGKALAVRFPQEDGEHRVPDGVVVDVVVAVAVVVVVVDAVVVGVGAGPRTLPRAPLGCAPFGRCRSVPIVICSK